MAFRMILLPRSEETDRVGFVGLNELVENAHTPGRWKATKESLLKTRGPWESLSDLIVELRL